MSKTVFIKPKEGLVIYDDKTLQVLPSEGKKVEMSVYWRRRIKAGEVIVVDQSPVKEEVFTKKEVDATNKKKALKESDERGF